VEGQLGDSRQQWLGSVWRVPRWRPYEHLLHFFGIRCWVTGESFSLAASLARVAEEVENRINMAAANGV
jgi:hypothetical protein